MITKKFGFSKTKRLKKPSDFQSVFSQPLRSRSTCFTVLARPNGLPVARARIGVMVAKRWVKLAAHRNYIRRIIRESFRLHQNELVGLDVVLMVRSNLEHQNRAKLDKCLEQHWRDLITLWKKA